MCTQVRHQTNRSITLDNISKIIRPRASNHQLRSRLQWSRLLRGRCTLFYRLQWGRLPCLRFPWRRFPCLSFPWRRFPWRRRQRSRSLRGTWCFVIQFTGKWKIPNTWWHTACLSFVCTANRSSVFNIAHWTRRPDEAWHAIRCRVWATISSNCSVE